MLLPSKGLLKAIVNENPQVLHLSKNTLHYSVMSDEGVHDNRSINIYELMNEMKDWACVDSRYMIDTYHGSSCTFTCLKNIDTTHEEFTVHDTEFNGVVKACEYLFEKGK